MDGKDKQTLKVADSEPIQIETFINKLYKDLNKEPKLVFVLLDGETTTEEIGNYQNLLYAELAIKTNRFLEFLEDDLMLDLELHIIEMLDKWSGGKRLIDRLNKWFYFLPGYPWNEEPFDFKVT